MAVNPRDRDVIVAAYRVFPDPAAYVSQIATAVSFDRGERWLPLGAVSSAPSANPALAFTDDGDALLITNEQSATWGLTVRRWSRPSRNDVARRRTWEAPAELATPPADSTDERPVLAAGRDGAVMACWARTTDLGAFGRQAVLCRHSADAGTTWADPSRPSPGQFTGVPYGPYVGGVALERHRGAFTVAWVDTLAGALDGSGLDSACVARSEGTGWSAPVRAALFRPLPDRFAGDSFRNVTLLSLAGSRERLYLAFGADSGDHADVRLVRSDDAGAHWGEPVTVGTGARDQFQPSVAVTRDSRVHVSFLDRRLDPGGRFADEWIATSRDAGTSWRERRLSHDSWDPAVGAPRSPTGDLLGDHQALAAAGLHARGARGRPAPGAPPRPQAAANRVAPALRVDAARVSPLLTGGARSVRGVKERIDELAKRLTELREAYYAGDPLVADAEFDALEDELRALIAEHPELTPDPNPLEQVGAPAALHAPVRHSRPMLSLDKVDASPSRWRRSWSASPASRWS